MKPSSLLIFCRNATLGLACLFAASVSSGAVLVTHSGSADPTTEGWKKTQGPSSGVSADAFTLGSTPVWRIVNTGGGTAGSHALYYSYSTTSTDFLSGWSIKVTLDVASSNISPNSQIAVGFQSIFNTDGSSNSGNSRVLYSMNFGVASNGNTNVQLSGESSIYTAPTDGFHVYELRYDPVAKAVKFYIDGVAMNENYQGNHSIISSVADYVFWGNTASAAASRTAYYNSVEFATVPEAGVAKLGLLGFGFMAVVLWGRNAFGATTKQN